MRNRFYWKFVIVTLIIPSFISFAFGEYEQVTQIGLPDGAFARIGKGAISKVVYAPDGTHLAVGSSIGVWIYDIETGKALDLFPMYGISCLAFSPDGKTLVSGSGHHLVLWDMSTGESLYTFIDGYQIGVESVAFSPDGKTLASGHAGGYLSMWDTATGKHISFLSGMGGDEGSILSFEYTGPVHGVAFSPDGKTLASAGYNDRGTEVRLWETATGKHLRLIARFDGEENSIDSIAFSPDGQTLAIGLGAGGITFWNTTKTGKLPEYFEGPKERYIRRVLDLVFNPNGTLLASCGEDKLVDLWDMKTYKHLKTFKGHKDDVFSVAFSPDGKTLVSSSKESVHLWNVKVEEQLRSIISHSAIMDVAFSPDGKTFASGNEDYTVGLWDTKTGKPITTLIGHEDKVFDVAYSPDGMILASSGDDGVRLWNARTGEHIRLLSDSKCFNIVFSPDGERLATKHTNSTVHLWHTKTGELLSIFTKQKHWVDGISFSPNGQTYALLRDESYNRSLWDIKADKLKCSIIAPVTKKHQWGVASSRDGSMLATGMVDKTPSGKRTNIVWLWDTTTGEHIRTLTGHLSTITCVAFSPDGKMIASGSEDQTVLIWDLETSKHPRILIGHNDRVLDVAFSPDGKTLASRSRDGIVLLWSLGQGYH